MSSAVPTLLCGKIPSHISATTEILKPDFEVVKVCTSPDEATAFLAAALAGDSYEGSSYTKPRLVIMGGGYTHENYEAARSLPGTDDITWLRPVFTKPGFDGPRPSEPPSAEIISGRARKAIDAHLEDLTAGKMTGEVIWF